MALLRLLAAAAVVCAGVGAPAYGLRAGSACTSTRGAASSYGRLPTVFERNTGRFDRRVRFVSRSGAGTLYITDREVVLSVASGAGRSALRIAFAGSKGASAAQGFGKQAGVVNYLVGLDPAKWHRNVPTYASVRLSSVWPGIDLVYYNPTRVAGSAVAAGPRARLEFDFVVRAGADPGRIKLDLKGAESLRLDGAGNLVAAVCGEEIALKRPVAYQEPNGTRTDVPCHFAMTGSRRASLRLGEYDRSQDLIIDPALVYSTCLGGSGQDRPAAIAVDAGGSAYVAGLTRSTDFPTTAGALQEVGGKYSNAFVTKLNPSGTGLVYSTYLGGSGSDEATGMVLDATGAAYVTGGTYSNDFPVTPGAYQTTCHGRDVFIAKLSPTGDTLDFSTYVGGSGNDSGYALAIDTTGCAYVTGWSETGFPTTPGAFRTSTPGSFVLKLSADGSALVYSTNLVKYPRGIAVDAAGCAYVVGSNSGDVPTTVGAVQRTYGGGSSDAFVIKLNSGGSALEYATYLGGSSSDNGWGVCVDASGAAYVTGTGGTGFPTTAGAFQTTGRGAFVTKLNPAGSQRVFSTLLGGPGGAQGQGICIDASGSPHITGETAANDFPTTPDAYQSVLRSPEGSYDTLLAKFDPTGTALIYSTYLGGSELEYDGPIAIDSSGAVYVTGTTYSRDFPTTPGAFSTHVPEGGEDAFVAKFVLNPTTPTRVTVTPAAGTVGESITLEATLAVAATGDPVVGALLEISVAGKLAGTAITDASGTAAIPFIVREGLKGSAVIAASYAGSPSYDSSTGQATLTVSPAQTTLTVPPSAGATGGSVDLSAVLSRTSDAAPVARRWLAFSVDGTSVGSERTDTSGVAALAFAIPGGFAGDHVVGVNFAGDTDYLPCTSTGVLTVRTGTDIYMLDRSGDINVLVELKAWLRTVPEHVFVPGKTIAFAVDGAEVGSAVTDADGRAALPWVIPSGSSPGAYPLVASFAGDSTHAPSTGATTLTVNRIGTRTYTVDRTGNGTEIIVLKGWLRRSDTLAWLPGRTLTFAVDGTEVASGITDSVGLAAVNWRIATWITPDSHTLTCAYAGDAVFAPSSMDATLVSTQTGTVMSMPDRSGHAYRIGNTAYLTAYLYRSNKTPLGGKTLVFSVDGSVVGSAVTKGPEVGGNGKAMLLWDIPVSVGAGSHSMRAAFAGDNGYTASHADALLTLEPGTLYIWPFGRSVVQGDPWKVSAYVRTVPDYVWQPGLTIQFLLDPGPDQVVLGSVVTDSAGVARLTGSSAGVPIGIHTVRMVFAGSADLQPAYAETVVNVVAP